LEANAGQLLRLAHFYATVTFHSFVHSFGHFYSAPSSPLLLRGAPDYSADTRRSAHPGT